MTSEPDPDTIQVMTPEQRHRRFEELYLRHRAQVRRFVRRRTPAAAVDDVVSETFLVAWRRLEEIEGEVLPWLLAVARRVQANYHRGAGRRDRLVERLAAEPSERPAGSEPSHVPEDIRAALNELPEADREVLRLVYWRELDSGQAARLLGRTPVAVRMRLHRARARLRHVLAERGLPGVLAPVGKLVGGAPATAPVVALSVIAAGAPAILTGDGTILSERTIGPGDPAPRTRYGQPRGAPLPRDQALVEATIRLPAGEHRPSWRWDRVTLTCPQGFVQTGYLSAGGGPRSGRVLASGAVNYSRSQARAGRTRRATVIFRPRPRLKRAATIRVGIVCMTPKSFWRHRRASMRRECEIFRRQERLKRAAG